jgi:hypothetical protein
MTVSSKLRNAEEHGVNAIHRGAEHLKSAIQDVNAGVRKLRARRYPASRPTSAHPDPEQELERAAKPKVRTGIVSVNGQDVGEMRCTGGRGPA